MAIIRNKIGGVAYLAVNGRNLTLAGDFKYSANKFSNETKIGRTSVDGYTTKPVAPFIEIEVRDAGDLLMSDFDGMDGADVVANLANGKTITGPNMWVVETQEVDTEESKFKLRFEGRDLIEVPTV